MFFDKDLEDNIPLIHFTNWNKQDIAPKLYHFQLPGPSSKVLTDITKHVHFFLLLFGDVIRLVTEQTIFMPLRKKEILFRQLSRK